MANQGLRSVREASLQQAIAQGDLRSVLPARSVYAALVVMSIAYVIVAALVLLTLAEPDVLSEEFLSATTSWDVPDAQSWAVDNGRQAGVVLLGGFWALGFVLGLPIAFGALWWERRTQLSRVRRAERQVSPPGPSPEVNGGVVFFGFVGGVCETFAAWQEMAWVCGIVAGLLAAVTCAYLYHGWRLRLWERRAGVRLASYPLPVGDVPAAEMPRDWVAIPASGQPEQ